MEAILQELTHALMLSLARLVPIAKRWPGAIRRMRGGYVSIGIVVAIFSAAAYTLPLGAGPGGVAPIWRVPKGGPMLTDATDLPVFCLPETGPAARCGIAQQRPDGRISFVPFGNSADLHGTLPVLASADIGLLWALADPAARDEVQASAAELSSQIAASVQQVTESDAWQHDYRDALRDVLGRAAEHAWRADDTQRAFRDLLRASEPVLQGSITNEIGPAVEPYVAEAFWRVVKANSRQVLSLIAGQPLDLSSAGTMLTYALQDPRVQAALGRVGPRLMDLPQSELLIERLVSNMSDALQRDPATAELLTRIAMDPRLGTELARVRNHVAEFVHQLGQVLWGLGSGSSMNALAGLSVKTEIVGASQPLILLLDPDDAAMLAHALPGRATLLVPETVP